jgi:hypothetical protein
MTPVDWPAAVAAVKHDPGPELLPEYPIDPKLDQRVHAQNEEQKREIPTRCAALGVWGWLDGNPYSREMRCNCTRDARIAAGIVAAIAARHNNVAVFRATSRPKRIPLRYGTYGVPLRAARTRLEADR